MKNTKFASEVFNAKFIPDTSAPRGGSKGKINVENFKVFVANNPDRTLSEIGIKFGIKASSVYMRLKALNFSYKKKPSPMWKQIKTSAINTKKP